MEIMRWGGYDENEEHSIETWNLNSTVMSDSLFSTVYVLAY
jgi:hypothetical protein